MADKEFTTSIIVEVHFPRGLYDDERLFIQDCISNQLAQVWKMLDNKYFPNIESINFKHFKLNDNE